MEGVMMKNGAHYACAVRKPDGTIEVDDQRTTSLGDKYKFFRLPIIRGVVAFVESLKIGIKTLTWSASFFEDEEENAKDSKKDTKGKNSGAADNIDEFSADMGNAGDVTGDTAFGTIDEATGEIILDDVSSPANGVDGAISGMDNSNNDKNVTTLDSTSNDLGGEDSSDLDESNTEDNSNGESCPLNKKGARYGGTDESLRSIKVTKSVPKEKTASE